MTGITLLWAATLIGAQPDLSWRQTDQSLALLRGTDIAWQFNYSKEDDKPCFHPLTIRDSGVLTDLAPADHPWHRGLWFSWKFINGINYWEPDPSANKPAGETELVDVKVAARPDHSSRFELDFRYHPPGKPSLMTEHRTIAVSSPANDGGYSIDWSGVFTAGDADVLLDRTPILGQPNGVSWGGYAGLSFRLAPALRIWQFADDAGPVKDRWKRARWMSFSGPTQNGMSAAIIVLEHPASFRHPTPWYCVPSSPYFSPATLYQSPYTIPAGKSIVLKYRILFQPGEVDRAAAEAQWQKFAKEK